MNPQKISKPVNHHIYDSWSKFYGSWEIFSRVHETEISPFINRFTIYQMMMTSLLQKVQQTVKKNLKTEKDLLKYQKKVYYALW